MSVVGINIGVCSTSGAGEVTAKDIAYVRAVMGTLISDTELSDARRFLSAVARAPQHSGTASLEDCDGQPKVRVSAEVARLATTTLAEINATHLAQWSSFDKLGSPLTRMFNHDQARRYFAKQDVAEHD